MSFDVNNGKLRVAVLVSGDGRGTNLQALIDACERGQIPAQIGVVIGTRSQSAAMDRARAAGVDTVVISPRANEGEKYGVALLRALRRRETGLVCLAGYLLKLPPVVTSEYAGRIMNIHPALLPLFGGRGMFGENVHRAVLESGMKISGCTVHFVDDEYDNGPIILQSAVPVEDEDTPATLAARILSQETRCYPEAVGLFAARRLRIDGRRVYTARADEEGETDNG